jgi:hypothetical protein
MPKEITETEGSPEKALKGFANPENRKNINLSGRPKGSRNKSTLIRAKQSLNVSAEDAAKFLSDLVNNNTGALDLPQGESVPLTLRLKAATEIINKSLASAKADLAAEVKLADALDNGEDVSGFGVEEDEDLPLFSTTAIKQ